MKQPQIIPSRKPMVPRAVPFDRAKELGDSLWPGLDDVEPIATIPVASNFGDNHYFIARKCGEIFVSKGDILSDLYDKNFITKYGFGIC